MNVKFIKLMIKAEQFKYMAIKEILPEGMKKRVDVFEKNITDAAKTLAIDFIGEYCNDGEEVVKKETKKVNVDFK